MLSVLPLPASELIQYLNIGFIAIIALCAIKGFFRGTMKSTYYFVASIIVFGLGWILMDPVINIIHNFDLSMADLEVDGIALTTPLNLISEMITRDNPDLALGINVEEYSDIFYK